MQQLFTGAGDAGTELLDRDGLTAVPLAEREYPDDRLIRRQLDEARTLVGNDDSRAARILCAEVVFDQMLRLAGNRELRSRAIATLIHARGFQLLSRLLLAVDGRRVRVLLGTPASETASPPHLIGRSEAQGVTTFTVSERLYSDPSRDTVIDRWSAELALGRERTAAAAAA